MTVSVIIVSYNTKTLTKNCICSLIENTKNLQFEIIVVDNGSVDGSLEQISKLQKKFKNIRLLKNRKNLGFAKANNQGIKIAKGDYILLLNSDTKVKKDALNKLVKCAQDKSDAGVVSPKLLNKDGSVQGSVFRFPTISKAIRQYWLGGDGLLDKYCPKSKDAKTVDAVVMACFLITPRAKKLVGNLDERYFMYFEDIEYCKKVHNSGLKVYYLPSAEVIHYHGKSGEKIGDIQKQRLIRSSKIYHGILKHYLLNAIIWSGQKWKRLRI